MRGQIFQRSALIDEQSCCSDFRNESNRKFVLGLVFLLAIFDGIFLYHSKGTVVLSLNLQFISSIVLALFQSLTDHVLMTMTKCDMSISTISLENVLQQHWKQTSINEICFSLVNRV